MSDKTVQKDYNGIYWGETNWALHKNLHFNFVIINSPLATLDNFNCLEVIRKGHFL